eukprot:COSAG02_NODE_8519_length_2539_cov_2.833607_4_plen_65_part_00
MPLVTTLYMNNWWYVINRGKLPHDMSYLHIDGEPLEVNGMQIIVTAVEPYLKRARENQQIATRT